jgi:hypothetical protein
MVSEHLDERPGGPSVTPSNAGSSKRCRTKQPAVVRLFENRNCRFEFTSLRQSVLSSDDCSTDRARFAVAKQRPRRAEGALSESDAPRSPQNLNDTVFWLVAKRRRFLRVLSLANGTGVSSSRTARLRNRQASNTNHGLCRLQRADSAENGRQSSLAILPKSDCAVCRGTL